MSSADNCWESMRCGREPGGPRSHEMGVCPAVIENRLDGSNGGLNAGRACWVVQGTLCHGQPCNDPEEKFETCARCEFYHSVQREEGADYTYYTSLLIKLKG